MLRLAECAKLAASAISGGCEKKSAIKPLETAVCAVAEHRPPDRPTNVLAYRLAPDGG
jgi:hypothetical protein